MAKSKLDKGLGNIDKIFLDDPRRALVILGFLVVIIILMVIFWSKIKNAWQNFRLNRSQNTILNDYEDQTGETTSLTNASYYQYANQLYNAFRPHMFGWGTDEDAVYNVFNNMTNTADVLKLVQTFGVKDGKTLQAWIRSELSSSELRKLNGILSAKGIQYSF